MQSDPADDDEVSNSNDKRGDIRRAIRVIFDTWSHARVHTAHEWDWSASLLLLTGFQSIQAHSIFCVLDLSPFKRTESAVTEISFHSSAREFRCAGSQSIQAHENFGALDSSPIKRTHDIFLAPQNIHILKC